MFENKNKTKYDLKNIKINSVEKLMKNAEKNTQYAEKAKETTKIDEKLTKDREVTKISLDKLVRAPEKWNIFPRLDEQTMFDMVYSIKRDTLYNPIIVWEQGDGTYMILSGHNRTDAFTILADNNIERSWNKWLENKLTIPTEDVNEKYLEIPAFVYGKDEITSVDANSIVIDTNYIARKDTKRLHPEIIKAKVAIEHEKGNYDEVALAEELKENLGIKDTTLWYLKKIGVDTIDEIAEFYYQGIVPQKQILIFSKFSKEQQHYIYDNYSKNINKNTVSKLQKLYREKEKEQKVNTNTLFTKKDFKEVFTIKKKELIITKKELTFKVEVPFKFYKDIEKEIQNAIAEIIDKYSEEDQ